MSARSRRLQEFPGSSLSESIDKGDVGPELMEGHEEDEGDTVVLGGEERERLLPADCDAPHDR